MNRFPTLVLLAVVLMLGLMACGGGTSLDEPPEILYGQDVCDECNMIINEPKHAAAYVTAEGEARRFDDIGDMLAYNQRNQEDVHQFWVHDYNTEAWVKADEAFFVVSSGQPTPMGWGILAFADQASADAFIAGGTGLIATWADLLAMMADGTLTSEMGMGGTSERLMIRLGRDQMCDGHKGHSQIASTVGEPIAASDGN
jgi:copper chaperone NosL